MLVGIYQGRRRGLIKSWPLTISKALKMSFLYFVRVKPRSIRSRHVSNENARGISKQMNGPAQVLNRADEVDDVSGHDFLP